MEKNFNNGERLDDFWVFPKLTKLEHKREYNDNVFSFLEENEDDTLTNLYIHIPFCDSGCIFCPYFKLIGDENFNKLKDQYIDALVKELKLYKTTKYFSRKKIATVHFGGGNPLLLEIEDFEKIIEAIKLNFEIIYDDSWTLEGSVNSVTSVDYMRRLKALGFSRISLGIQTFNENIRRLMHIKSSVQDIYSAVEILNEANFNDYCFDLMYNLPNQTEEDLIQDISKADELNPMHIDIYNMAVFPNTYIDKKIKEQNYYSINPSNENNIRMYKLADKYLTELGYAPLTTNTYSKRQQEIHRGDWVYLTNNNVLGLGASSRGYISGFSYKNVCDISEYIQQVDQNRFPANLSLITDKDEQESRLMIMFPIRLKIMKEEIKNIDKYRDRLDYLKELGLVIETERYIELTNSGRLWSGNISTLFISNKDWKTYLKIFLNAIKEKNNPYNEDKMGVDNIV